MYDWVTTAPKYYENYAYDQNYNTSSLPPKPVANNRSSTSNNLAQQIQKRNSISNSNLNKNVQPKTNIKTMPLADDIYPKPNRLKQKYTYQTQAESVNNLPSYNRSLSNQKSSKQIYSNNNNANKIKEDKKYYIPVESYLTLATAVGNDDDVEVYENYEDDQNEYYNNNYYEQKDDPEYQYNNKQENLIYYLSNPDDYGKFLKRFKLLIAIFLFFSLLFNFILVFIKRTRNAF
jgi:hypothetical protein